MAENLIPPGNYAARPVSWQLGTTKEGKPQVEVAFVITQACEHTGEPISWFGFFTDKTFETTVKALQLMGFDSDDLSTINEVGPQDVEVSLKIQHEQYEGKTQARVRWVNDPNFGGLVSKRMDEADAKAFAKNMRAQMAALKKPKAALDDTPF